MQLRYVLAVLVLIAGNASAQTNGSIHGRVVDSTSSIGLAAVTVDVYAASIATRVVHRATTAADGAFRIDRVASGRYRLLVRALGHRPVEIRDVAVVSAAVDVGIIRLSVIPRELANVAVTTQRQEVELALDRNTYAVKEMPATRGGSALDVLRNVPAVDVDIDNVVSLRGNSGVTIQINGRPSALKAAQLGDYLAQLPAGMVDKVEIVTNPSARDDPTGVAGIINIVLKREPDGGTNGGLTTSGSTTGRFDAGVNVGAQKGNRSAFGSYTFYRDQRPQTQAIYRENYFTTPLTFLDESGYRSQYQRGHTLTGSATYQPTEHDEFSADALFVSRIERELNTLTYRDLNTARVSTGLSDRSTANTNDRYNIESTVGYKHGFAQKGHRLSSELQFSTDQEGGPLDVTGRLLSGSSSVLTAPLREHSYALERPTDSYLKVDYIRPVASNMRLELGYKGSFERFHTELDTRVLNQTSGAFLPDSSRTNNFTYDQLVNAGYVLMSAPLNRLLIQVGSRFEHAATQFDVRTQHTRYDNSYNSVFPSALIGYTFRDGLQAKISYATRIRRPDDTDQLDPSLHYQDPLNVSVGNPYLRPEYTRALELGLQRATDRTTILVTPFWRHTIDAVRSIRTIDAAGVATRSFANVATSDAYGGDATLGLNGGKLTGFAGASAYYQRSNASNIDAAYSASTFGWRARGNAAWRVSRQLDFQALASYQAAMNVEQGRNGSRSQVSLAGRRKLLDDRLSITMRVIDPFSLSSESSITIDPRYLQTSVRARQVRGLLLSVNWTFGKPEKEGKVDLMGSDPGAP